MLFAMLMTFFVSQPHEPQVVMGYLASNYTLKKGSVKEPDAYLGAEVKKWTIDGAENPSKVR